MGHEFKCRCCGKLRRTEWIGACKNCGRWGNCIKVPSDRKGANRGFVEDDEVMSFQDAVAAADDDGETEFLATGIAGLDYVLGGGLPSESVILLSGDPGIGKTTLLVQALQGLARQRHDVIYVTAEESAKQLGRRYKRLGKFPARMQVIRRTELTDMIGVMDDVNPAVSAIDSIQKVKVEEWGLGSPSSIGEATAQFTDYSKRNGRIVILVGHITKDGTIGGPKDLEHDVDVSLEFRLPGKAKSKPSRKGDPPPTPRRVLVCTKNRFAFAPREAHFLMTETGLVTVADGDQEATDPAPQRKPARRSRPLPVPQPDPPREPGRASGSSGDPAASWCAPDGTTATEVLAVNCDEDGCRGKKDRACTAGNGKREAGFHPSRVAKAQGRHVAKPAIEETPEPTQPDPFARPLGAPPRLKGKRPTLQVVRDEE